MSWALVELVRDTLALGLSKQVIFQINLCCTDASDIVRVQYSTPETLPQQSSALSIEPQTPSLLYGKHIT